MKFVGLSMVLITFATGCIQSHRAPPVVYYVPATTLTPTSESPNPRVYVPSVPAIPPNVSATDLSTADEVAAVLNGEPSLAGPSQNVLVSVKDGVVTLRGTTPSESDRLLIVQRVSKLPGVAGVRDELGLSGER